MQVEKMEIEELQWEILNNDELYRCFDEQKFLAGCLSREELVSVIQKWIIAGDESLKTEKIIA